MAKSILMSLCTPSLAKGSIAFFDKLTKVTRMGMINGKLSMAIKLALLSVLAEMAEIKVKVTENPRLPRPTASRKGRRFTTAFPTNKLNPPQVSNPINSKRSVL